MPLDPSLSLDVVGGGGPHAPAAPMGLGGQLGQILPTINTLNQVKLFNQEFAARRQAGNIIAASPDLDTGVQRLLSDPDVAGFAPQIVTEMRNAQVALTNLRGAQMTQAHTAWDAMMKASVGAIDNPGQLTSLMQQQLALMPPEIRSSVLPAAKDWVTSLTAGLPSDPAQAQTEYNKRLTSRVMGAGVDPAKVFAAAGTVPPTIMQTPTGPGNTLQVQMMGGLGAGARGPNVLATAPLSPSQEDVAKGLGGVYADQGLREYQAAQATQGAAVRMGADIDKLAAGGGFLTPGTLGSARVQVARAVNTLADGFGLKQPFDPSKIGAGESLMKETRTMGFQLVNTMFGAQREAYQTINGATASVPGIENSTLGARLVMENIAQTAQRAIDWREFQTGWLQDPQHKTLIGAAEAFNKQHPAQDYAKAGLAKFGLAPDSKLPDVVKAMQPYGDVPEVTESQYNQLPSGAHYRIPGKSDIYAKP